MSRNGHCPRLSIHSLFRRWENPRRPCLFREEDGCDGEGGGAVGVRNPQVPIGEASPCRRDTGGTTRRDGSCVLWTRFKGRPLPGEGCSLRGVPMDRSCSTKYHLGVVYRVYRLIFNLWLVFFFGKSFCCCCFACPMVGFLSSGGTGTSGGETRFPRTTS